VTPETAWRTGRLSSRKGPQRLLFGRMHEDAEIERSAFEGKGRIFCIASAGTTALALAAQHEVVACDINPVQLAYAERIAAGGAAETGDAERAMKLARIFMPLVGWRKEVLREFLAMDDLEKQTGFWRKHLDTRRFRAGFDTMMSPAILRMIYAAPFLAFLPSNFGAVLRKRLERGFATHKNASNPYARALLLGATPENGRRRAKGNIRFVLGDAAEWLENSPEGYFDGFALSNIVDGAGEDYKERLARAVRRAASDNAIVVSRSFAEPPPGMTTNRAESDRSMLWGVVDVRSARDF
jgi:S-adenosylmethionine:diacylglycerol 3-amino-3-carboxypropyl transferase